MFRNKIPSAIDQHNIFNQVHVKDFLEREDTNEVLRCIEDRIYEQFLTSEFDDIHVGINVHIDIDIFPGDYEWFEYRLLGNILMKYLQELGYHVEFPTWGPYHIENVIFIKNPIPLTSSIEVL